ncbi:hypothetical protein [Thiobacillus sp.]|uniref:hypothetical protein n=1 Tax=Thiobacillus sp. TaxID=924 RepID=UPI0025D892D3|nr:hypothetical protein [Thiobacillus sp.]MBT9539129.1 hypothetical protein [Thiobacillus sp.]
MTNDIRKTTFLQAAEAWVCNGYSLDVRFLASPDGIMDASIALNPLPSEKDTSFQIDGDGWHVGHIQEFPRNKRVLLTLLSNAVDGVLTLPGKRLTLPLPERASLDLYSNTSHSEPWYSPLHLRISGGRIPLPAQTQLRGFDNALRVANNPFDGISDVTAWLGLVSPLANSNPPSINIHIGPPVDIIFEKCSLIDDRLQVTLHAHPKFNVNDVALMIRTVPGAGLNARQQIASQIRWGRVKDGLRVGTANIVLTHADSVFGVLMIKSSPVRRQWFIDATKARNNRFLAIQHFDKDLRMVRNALLESADSSKFEQGIAALLFLLGFTPVIPIETNSPDIVVTTPGGKLIVVECTTRIADFASKLGKLVDRRGSLSKSLASSGHPASVFAVLVCRLPRDQIAAQVDQLATHNALLATREDIESGLDKIRYPNDPDQMLDKANARLSNLMVRLNT